MLFSSYWPYNDTKTIPTYKPTTMMFIWDQHKSMLILFSVVIWLLTIAGKKMTDLSSYEPK